MPLVPVEERGRQAGNRACAGDYRDTGFPCSSVQLTDGGDELAGIRQVKIVGPRRNCGARDPVVRGLERARRVDDDMRADLS